MQLEEIQEATNIVEEDLSNTASDQRKKNTETESIELIPPEELDNAEGNGSQELTEQELDEFIKGEQIAASEGNNADISSKYTPQMSMEFKDRNDAHHFFNFYAYLAGFEVIITHVARTTSKKRNNEIFKVTMKCHKNGKQQPTKTLEQQEAEGDKDLGKEKG